MIKLLARLFIKDNKNYVSPVVRKQYGILCSTAGIGLNLILFILKLIAGTISGSVAVTVDAVHNLTDMGSSVVTFISFFLSGQKPCKNYPCGKGRTEYIAGFIISMVLIFAGAELAKASVEKIITPEPVTFSWLSLLILLCSFFVKIYMSCFNRSFAKKINSAALKAASVDCLCDSFTTVISAIAIISVKFTDINIDAYGGLMVSLFIVYAGLKAAKDSSKSLIGVSPNTEFNSSLEKIICSCGEISTHKSPVIHDYGPNKKILTMDIGFPPDKSFTDVYMTADCIEERIRNELGCEAIIRVYPYI